MTALSLKALNILALLLASLGTVNADAIMVGDVEISPADFASQLPPEKRIAKCLACHGGRAGGDIDFGPDAQFGTPALSGMREEYLRDSLVAYKNGTRSHEEMSVVSSLLDQETIDFMAATLSAMEVPAAKSAKELSMLSETDALFLEGQTIAQQGVPESGVPVCTACHGMTGEGSAVGPRLAGQNVMYIENQFKAFAEGTRQTAQSAVMLPAVSGLEDDEIRAVAYYYSLLLAISVSEN